LPKAYRALTRDPRAFADEDAAMVELGLGKNMVRALRFWVEAMGVAVSDRKARALHVTPFGHAVFGEDGWDRYLEDPRTLWLLHWNLSSRDEGGLFAWRFMIGHWPYPEFTRTEVLQEFRRVTSARGVEHSDVTLAQHLDVFLHTYMGSRVSAAVEDSLDGPLVDLELLSSLGQRRGAGGRWEPVYSFRREAKPEIGQVLFDYCLADFWRRFAPADDALTLRAASLSPTSPGQVFKLPEADMRNRAEASAGEVSRGFIYQPSAIQGLLFRNGPGPSLADVYAEDSNV
jgi:hypothetical protein